LEPVRLSSRNDYLKLDSKIEHELSPSRHLAHLICPTIVAYGEHESREFFRQAREFAAAVERIGHLQALIEGRGYNHFEIINTLRDAKSPLAQAVLQQMGLCA
jgi:arylformamidase